MSCTNCCDCDKELDLLAQFPEKRAELEAYIASLPLSDDREKNRGYLIQSLHKAQEIFTYLPESVQLFVADRLNLHLSEVYGVISFYSFFTDTPVGDYKINVCTGTACFVKGAGAILDEFKRYLNLEEGETAEDGKFSLGGLRCVGACSLAPVVMVNDKVYGNVTKQMVPEIINDCE
ncbi:MAG: NAD(P)H-dependent oxidoreductase subunit E [Victivallaceae bacterium]|nr:NAD(P)H-dependent oxidoreductase subunit E [Victivallaceae bacterium]